MEKSLLNDIVDERKRVSISRWACNHVLCDYMQISRITLSMRWKELSISRWACNHVLCDYMQLCLTWFSYHSIILSCQVSCIERSPLWNCTVYSTFLKTGWLRLDEYPIGLTILLCKIANIQKIRNKVMLGVHRILGESWMIFSDGGKLYSGKIIRIQRRSG